MNRDLTDITPSEALFLWRRRRNLTSAAAAARLGVAYATWSRAEHGEGAGVQAAMAGAVARIAPTTPEALRLARRRYGRRLRETARLAGVSHVTYLAAERAGAEWLMRFWEGRRFRGFTDVT